LSEHQKILMELNNLLMNIYKERMSITSSKSKTIKHKGKRSHKYKGNRSYKYKGKRSHKYKGKRKNKRTHKKNKLKNRRTRRRRSYKGGYHQFNSNVPISSNYSVVPSGTSNMNAPPMIQKINGNCKDNYNHYTGKSFES